MRSLSIGLIRNSCGDGILERRYWQGLRCLSVEPLPRGSTDYPDDARGGWLVYFGPLLLRWSDW